MRDWETHRWYDLQNKEQMQNPEFESLSDSASIDAQWHQPFPDDPVLPCPKL